ncbi:30S ribosomal protein S1 [Methylophilaceae bacterium]|nr:30S ribosomal protein S1 [Methylophilaceae bacterium]
MFTIPDPQDMYNESDVEQKFVFPLLTSPLPIGLGLSSSYIQTKANIRRFQIGKGKESKLYYPDYLIVVAGLPLAVIEVKGPGEDLIEAFREARLYANELNGLFSSGYNPVQFVVSINASQLFWGRYDQAEPSHKIDIAQLSSYSDSFVQLQNALSKNAVEVAYEQYIKSLSHLEYKKPRRLLGGLSVQNEEIGTNKFGATIAADFAHIFNPTTREDRAFIAHNGYIPSRRRERYVDPIDRVIRASRPISEVHSTAIDDTGNPKEVLSQFKELKPLEHQVLLLVGSVGSGKSTFVDYLYEVALPRDVINASVWIRVNMNPAPISKNEIYDWLRDQITQGCQAAYPEVDFDDISIIQNVFSVEVNKYKKGIGKLLESDPQAYSAKLAETVERALNDKQVSAIAHTRYCSTERGKLLVIVLDNCDKRTRDEQLLMFQAAQWVQKEFRGLVILPLREETFDSNRDKPPLDTALKDLVFRIEAPLFQNLLIKRVQLALNEIGKSMPNTLSYELANGFRVEYPANDMAFYLTSILKSIFEHDRYIRSMIVGLSARNMRRAMEIFLEFCTSGHIPEDQIFRIRSSEGKHTLPLHLVTRVLLRMTRRYYDNDFSYLKNIFAANWKDERPTYFGRLMILRWLFARISEFGPSREKGFFSISTLKQELSPLGLELKVIEREVEALLKALCIVSEDLRTENLGDDDLIRIAPAGIVHLDMLNNIDYLGAVAEDTYFDDENIARSIARRIGDPSKHYTRRTSLQNAKDLVTYLEKMRSEQGALSERFLEISTFNSLTDLTICHEVIESSERASLTGPWVDAVDKYPIGSQAEGIVINTVPFGAFIELQPGLTGLLHRAQYPNSGGNGWNPMVGDRLIVKIHDIDNIKQRITFNFVNPLIDHEA